MCYANSLGSESVVLTDLIWGAVPQIDIFSIDTGRLYPETYDLIERLQQRYGRALTIYYPKNTDLEGWVGRARHQRLSQRPRSAPRLLRHSQGGAIPPRDRRPQRLGHRHPARTIGQPRAGVAGGMGRRIRAAQGESACWNGRKTKSGNTSARSACPTTPCTTAAFRASAARPARAPCNPARTKRSGRWWWERNDSRECGLHPRRQAGFSK